MTDHVAVKAPKGPVTHFALGSDEAACRMSLTLMTARNDKRTANHARADCLDCRKRASWVENHRLWCLNTGKDCTAPPASVPAPPEPA